MLGKILSIFKAIPLIYDLIVKVIDWFNHQKEKAKNAETIQSLKESKDSEAKIEAAKRIQDRLNS